MVKGIFCSHCGTNNQVKRFKCSQCHSFIRPVYPTVLGVATLLVIYLEWLLFVTAIVPAFADILASHGAKFGLFVRVAIELGQYFTGWGVIVGLLFIVFLLWLGLYWRPNKAYGRNVVLTVVLAKAAAAFAVFLLAVLDILPFIATK